jgi:peroxiredoxin
MNALRFLLLLVIFGSAGAVEVGQEAPDFSLPTFQGDTFNLADHQGKVVVILTIGCT